MFAALSPVLFWISRFAKDKQSKSTTQPGGEMSGLAQGDPSALAEFVAKNEAWARRFAARAIGDEGDAEDIVQEAFLSLWRQAPSLPAETDPARWLLMVISRRSADYKRKKLPTPTDELPEFSDPSPSPREQAAHTEQREILAQLIAQLDSRQRTALLLTLQEGISMHEGAQMMDMNQKAFESLLHRARLQLADFWRRREEQRLSLMEKARKEQSP